MTSSTIARSRPVRLRRIGASVLLASGLLAVGTVVLPAPAQAAPAHAAPKGGGVIGLRLGSRGNAVKVLQRALIGLGIRIPGGADGVFGERTQWAVRWFQANNGLSVTGVVNEATAKALKIGPGSRPAPAPEPAAPARTSNSTLARGARGPAVVKLQQALIRAGVAVAGGADGIFGAATESALRQFQQRKGLAVTGTLNTPTAAALGLGGAPAPSAPAPQSYVGLKLGSRGAAVKAVQQAIIRTGLYLQGGADGVFGLATQKALMLVQRTNGIPASGVVDAATARALKLGGTTTPSATLRRGARGAAVKTLQRALMAKGIYVAGGADGIFGPATETALRRFQRRNGLAVTGAVDAATASALGLGPSPQPEVPSGYVGLRLGSSGEAVKAVQRALIATGMVLYGGADGIFGAATKNALMLFQRANGISPTGIVDAATAKLLGLSNSATPYPTPGRTAAGYASYNERGARVVALQTALIRAGIAVRGGADGVFGSATAAAVIAFQRAKGLSPTGKVDTATARALGLRPMDAPSTQPAPTVRLDAKPVQGPCWTGDTWLAPRGSGRLHLGTDIIAARGNKLYAVTTGRISQVYKNYRGSLAGNGIKIARPDGTYFFYAHMLKLPAGIEVGTTVRAGQVVGWVGSTGNAAGPHLHFEIHPGGGAAINPYPSVKAIGAC